MDNLSYLFAAYSAIWLVIFVYVFSLHRREKELWRQVELLRHRLDESSSEPAH